MLVGLLFQIFAQGKEIIHEMRFENLDVLLLLLSFEKSLPSLEEVLEGYDIIVGMNQFLSCIAMTLPGITPPKKTFACFA